MRKLYIPIIFAAIILIAPAKQSGAAQLKIVATFLPVWYVVQNVVGTGSDVNLIVKPPAELHGFTFRPRHLRTITGSDVLFLNGGGLEYHMQRATGMAPMTVELAAAVEVMPSSAKTPDPHFWLDPLSVAAQAGLVRQTLVKLHPAGAAGYTANTRKFIDQLKQLDTEIKALLAPHAGKQLVTYHEAFNYFARRYGLIPLSLSGPTGSAPLPSRLRTVYDSAAPAVFVEAATGASELARIARDLGTKVCTLDTLQSGADDKGYYINAMKTNAQTIARCLERNE